MTITATQLSDMKAQARARYLALPTSLRTCLDFWLDHAVRPATGYDEINKAAFENWPGADRHPYVSNEAFNGALLLRGYDLKPYREATDLDFPAQFNARFTRAVHRELREGFPTPLPWDAEFNRLAAQITADDARVAWRVMVVTA